jgi:hypothetical protein
VDVKFNKKSRASIYRETQPLFGLLDPEDEGTTALRYVVELLSHRKATHRMVLFQDA